MSTRFPDEMSAEELSAYRRAAKEALRKRVAAVRRTLLAEARAERSQRACSLLLDSEPFARAQVILSYAPLRFEADPQSLVERAHALGKQVLLPRVDQETHTLVLHAHRPGDELAESGMGIREPLESAPVVAPELVDLVLVPGLAFDGRGYRLGYGKGFYDRLLPLLTRATPVGLAFELSLLPEVPSEPHDVPVHGVATEKRLLWVQELLRD